MRAPIHSTLYRSYVLGLLLLAYVLNTADRSPVLGVSLQAIKMEFGASDAALGLLTGITFALFYSTMGIPIAVLADRTHRVRVLSAAVVVWSVMTMLCGSAASFVWLLAARAGVAVGEAGCTPPSHSLVSDYFPRDQRGRAFAVLALGVGIGTTAGNLVAGSLIDVYGWRVTFAAVGLPGVLVGLLIAATVREPPRGQADGIADAGRPLPVGTALRALWHRPAFRHICLAAGFHSLVWYATGAFTIAFLQRSHGITAGRAANVMAAVAIASTAGTLAGGWAADRLSRWRDDARWNLWVPAIATFLCVPFQVGAYLSGSLAGAVAGLLANGVLAAVFFGPSFAMVQRLAEVRARSLATSVMLFTQTLIGYGLGPLIAGMLSDRFTPAFGKDALGIALAMVALVNVWAASHYALASRTLRADLAGLK